MKNKQVFDILKGNFSKGENNVENYLPFHQQTVKEKPNSETEKEETHLEERLISKEPLNSIIRPRICIYDFLNDTKLKQLNDIKNKQELRMFIEKQIPRTCRDPSRSLYVELMYTVLKFGRRNNFNMKQTGAILSQFYLTHMTFTSTYNMAAEKVYLYFKEIMICHSASSPPDSIKIFTMEESENIMNFFFKVYLRNLPLIRTMSLPNFAFHLDTSLEIAAPLLKRTEEKEAKDKHKNKKK